MPRALAAIAAVALLAAPLAAQDAARAVRFGVQGGLVLPMGDFGDRADPGFLVAGTADWRLVNRPFALRFDLGYHRTPVTSGLEALGVDPVSIIAGTANAVVAVPTTGVLRPYVVGGAGVYHVRVSGELPLVVDVPTERRARPSAAGAAAGARVAQELAYDDSETKPGVQVGFGLGFPVMGLASYVEARYHMAFTTDARTVFVPVVFGLRF